MKYIFIILAIPALLLPAACLLYIIYQAMPALGLDLLLGSDTEVVGVNHIGQSLLPQITGSLLMMGLACLLALPIALSLALFHAFWAKKQHQYLLMTLLQIMQGIPPIVYGLCGLIILVHTLKWGISLAAGAVILAIIILPLLSSSMIHAFSRISREQTDAALSLGLSKFTVMIRVWLPASWSAILTGLLLSMARALSETAPILFTATVFSGITWPDSIFSPVTSLQTHIFYLAQEGSNIQAIHTAWASAAVLLALVLCFALFAWYLRRFTTS
ncbi:MAG: ABC transporter permease subunit [Ghiorsea sp.]|nr:ABC transporter permease subunit [Ghiorsea sp.]